MLFNFEKAHFRDREYPSPIPRQIDDVERRGTCTCDRRGKSRKTTVRGVSEREQRRGWRDSERIRRGEKEEEEEEEGARWAHTNSSCTHTHAHIIRKAPFC